MKMEFKYNTINITQSYLEEIYKRHNKVNELISIVLERSVEAAKRGDNMSVTCVHKEDFTYEQLKLAGDELISKGFKANYSVEKEIDVNGYVGEIQVRFYDFV